MYKPQGFTLIELMIVIAVLAILMLFAVPAYQNYSVRAQNGECIGLAASAKLAIAETAMERGVLATAVSAENTGWSFPEDGTKFCTAMVIGDNGTIRATSAAGEGGDIVFAPVQANLEHPIDWTCASEDYTGSQLPGLCRDDA